MLSFSHATEYVNCPYFQLYECDDIVGKAVNQDVVEVHPLLADVSPKVKRQHAKMAKALCGKWMEAI